MNRRCRSLFVTHKHTRHPSYAVQAFSTTILAEQIWGDIMGTYNSFTFVAGQTWPKAVPHFAMVHRRAEQQVLHMYIQKVVHEVHSSGEQSIPQVSCSAFL